MKKMIFNVITTLTVITSAQCFGANTNPKEAASKKKTDSELQEQSGPMTPKKLREHVAQLSHQGLAPAEYLLALDCAKTSANSMHNLALMTKDLQLETDVLALIADLNTDTRTIRSSVSKTPKVN